MASRTPEGVYSDRLAQYTAERDRLNAQRYAAANASVILFFGLLALLAVAVFSGNGLFYLATVAALAGFVLAFRRQGQLDDAHRRYLTLVKLQEEGLARLRRDWAHIPPPEAEPESTEEDAAEAEAHLAAGDIDLLGHASLQHLLNTANTPAGRTRLRGWILSPATPETIRERQAAARELAPDVEAREELTLFGRLSGMTRYEYGRFLGWAERAPWLTQQPALIWASRIIPALTVLALLVQLVGLTQLPLFLAGVALNIALTYGTSKRIEELLDEVSERQVVFLPYATIFRFVERRSFEAPLLRRVQADLAAERVNADEQMGRLAAIMRFGDLRLSLLFPILQAFLLWNFQTLWLLERWQRAAGPHVRRWLERLAEAEALGALGTLAFENPAWAWPEIAEGETPLVVGRDLGHPLLPPDVCVGNDVTLGPPGTLLLVTGSNMSGKSTLLRAIGVDATLAQMGGPVCAAALRLPPVQLATSMRISDSLEYGVSYFMAELRRLKQVVDDAERTAAGHAQTPLFLLDEILHGTNTTERQIAVRHILLYLLRVGAIGAVSTHDLSLASLPQIAPVSHTVHFTEHFERGPDGTPEMTFDYKLREGVATSTNALKLMEIVGLPVVE
jgi:hypothetical protein